MWLYTSKFTLDGWQEMRKTLLLDSGDKWPSVWISSWIHWNEHYGVQVAHDFLERLQTTELALRKWKIALILAWNEEALLQSKRWVKSWNKYDLNRLVDPSTIPEEMREDSYEQRRWAEIQKLIDITEPVSWLDLHSFSAPRWKPYAFSSSHGFQAIGKNLWIQNMAINMANANKDAHAWVRLWSWVSDYVNFRWANGFTFEAWYHNDPNCFLATYQALVNFLVAHDMMEAKQVRMEWDKIIFDTHNAIVPIGWETSSHVHIEYRHSHIPEEWGKFEYSGNIPQSFTQYTEWEIIGYDIYPDGSRKEVKAQFNGFIILPKDPKICTPGDEVFYYGKNMSEV